LSSKGSIPNEHNKPEGYWASEDKPLKYPTIFNGADVAVITKLDLAEAVEFDAAATEKNIRAVRPGMPVLSLSAKTGEGMAEFLEFLETRPRNREAVGMSPGSR
jgi:hydrogenase nickel incorporation protein HypB